MDVHVGMVARDARLSSRLARAFGRAGVECVARAPTARSLAAAAAPVDTVVIYDDSDGAALPDLVREAREALPQQRLIVVWPASDAMCVRKTLRAGAAGLVSEAELDETLGAAVEAVRAGLICVPHAMRAPLERETLSMREKQILGMLVTGYTNAEIASRLYLAESTVKSHLSSAYAKLGVSSRQQAARMILDPDEGLSPGILAIAASTGVRWGKLAAAV